ncbi:hypothetical protein CCP1ISM_100014 [Azospirillaceae bacterium]
MIDNNNWYFDHLTEDIVYGDIKAGGPWLEMARRLKKNAVIRKIGDSQRIASNTLPTCLGQAIDEYRRDRQNKEGRQ